jgi:hypothetical protein
MQRHFAALDHVTSYSRDAAGISECVVGHCSITPVIEEWCVTPRGRCCRADQAEQLLLAMVVLARRGILAWRISTENIIYSISGPGSLPGR